MGLHVTFYCPPMVCAYLLPSTFYWATNVQELVAFLINGTQQENMAPWGDINKMSNLVQFHEKISAPFV